MDVNAGAGKKLNDYQKLRTILDAIGGLLQDVGTHEGGIRWLRVIYFFVQKRKFLTGKFRKFLVGIDSEDGTKYSPEEYAILKSTGQPIPLQVHIIKKMFDGLLVSAGNRS